MIKKALILFGTRPEGIKMAPLYHSLNKSRINVKTCNTGQHKEMLDEVVKFFDIKVDYNLKVLKEGQSLNELISKIIKGLDHIINYENPDIILVHGDTTTALAGSLAGFYKKIKVAHIEAGLRTYNSESPFPEEINRQLIGRISNLNFCPTNATFNNLNEEKLNLNAKSYVVGNTVIDSVKYAIKKIKKYDSITTKKVEKSLEEGKKGIITCTIHRRENHERIFKILKILKKLSNQYDDYLFVIPVHPNPKVNQPIHDELGSLKNILLTEPLGYLDFTFLMSKSSLIITDSGGIQEEATAIEVPVLILRDETERPEALTTGYIHLTGIDEKKILELTKFSLTEYKRGHYSSKNKFPFGEGNTSKLIRDILLNE